MQTRYWKNTSVVSISICLVTAGLKTARPASAEILNCNGRWTNLSCETVPQQVMTEKGSSSADAEAGKARVIRELDYISARVGAMGSLGAIAVAEARSFCLLASTSEEKCEQRVFKAQKIAQEALEKERKRGLETERLSMERIKTAQRERKLRLEEWKARISANKTKSAKGE